MYQMRMRRPIRVAPKLDMVLMLLFPLMLVEPCDSILLKLPDLMLVMLPGLVISSSALSPARLVSSERLRRPKLTAPEVLKVPMLPLLMLAVPCELIVLKLPELMLVMLPGLVIRSSALSPAGKVASMRSRSWCLPLQGYPQKCLAAAAPALLPVDQNEEWYGVMVF